jgi:hypothetical protein
LLQSFANHSYGRFYEADETDLQRLKDIFNGIAFEQ